VVVQHEDRALVEGEPAKRLVQLVSVRDRLDIVYFTCDVGLEHANG
jgi:hypothetical protein